MLQAMTAPVLKSLAVAGLALGVGIAASSSQCDAVTHRLALHAVDAPNAIYISAFRGGDIRVRFSDGEIRPFRIETRASLYDGCQWVGIETFVPRDARSFDYEYNERIVSCEPGATPYVKTPRKGLVTIED